MSRYMALRKKAMRVYSAQLDETMQKNGFEVLIPNEYYYRLCTKHGSTTVYQIFEKTEGDQYRYYVEHYKSQEVRREGDSVLSKLLSTDIAQIYGAGSLADIIPLIKQR